MATHPYLVWAGSEIRVYAMAIFLSAALFCAVYDAHFTKVPKRWSRASYVAVGFSACTPRFVGSSSSASARHSRPDATQGDGARSCSIRARRGPLGAAFFAAHAQIDSHANDLGPQLAMGESGLHVLVTRFENLLFSWNQTIDEGRWSLAQVRVARWFYRALIVRRPRGSSFASRSNIAWRRFFSSRPLWIVVFAYALCMLVLFRVAGPWAVGARHVAGLFVPVTLALLSFPALALSRGALRGWGIFLIATNAVSVLMMQVMPLAKDCDCRRVAAALTSLAANGEPILVFPSEDAMPLSLYYPGPNRLLPIPRPPSTEHWDQQSFVIESPADIAGVLDREAPGQATLWVHTSDYGDRWGRDRLEAFLARGYREDDRLRICPRRAAASLRPERSRSCANPASRRRRERPLRAAHDRKPCLGSSEGGRPPRSALALRAWWKYHGISRKAARCASRHRPRWRS